VNGGSLRASSGSRSFAVLAAPVAGQAVIVEPAAFAGASPEDSLFLGLSGGDLDNALAWYNNHFGSSGADVRIGGVGHPEAAGGCCAAVEWSPGDRFAVLNRWGKLTTWLEHDGGWTLLHSAPVGALPSSWSPAFGLRLDSGTISVDRFTVRALSG
jgi:hypothetical protein